VAHTDIKLPKLCALKPTPTPLFTPRNHHTPNPLTPQRINQEDDEGGKMDTDDLSDGDEGEGPDKNDGGGLGREKYACGTYELPVPKTGLLSPAFLSNDKHISRRKVPPAQMSQILSGPRHEAGKAALGASQIGA
jgi:hypothetical protein